jgi:5'-nucleotidase (lipoprotein e(P4) family)
MINPEQASSHPSTAMQFLYGSGEAAALSRQAFAAFTSYALTQASLPPAARRSVVLAPGTNLSDPIFTTCKGKPTAVVLDTDETSVLNVGFEADQAQSGADFDPQRWDKWERTGDAAMIAVPGVREAVRTLRLAGVTVVFNSNRTSRNAADTERQLDELGLGPARHGSTLFLAGDDATGSNKDERRRIIAGQNCVIAMAGDQLGDFSDRFNSIPGVRERRAATGQGSIAKLWGNGWFVLPNPVYGSATKGNLKEIFSLDHPWP